MYILSHAITGFREGIQKQRNAHNTLDSGSAYWYPEEDADITEKEAGVLFPFSQALGNMRKVYGETVTKILSEHDDTESLEPLEQCMNALSDPWITLKSRVIGIMEAIK